MNASVWNASGTTRDSVSCPERRLEVGADRDRTTNLPVRSTSLAPQMQTEHQNEEDDLITLNVPCLLLQDMLV